MFSQCSASSETGLIEYMGKVGEIVATNSFSSYLSEIE